MATYDSNNHVYYAPVLLDYEPDGEKGILMTFDLSKSTVKTLNFSTYQSRIDGLVWSPSNSMLFAENVTNSQYFSLVVWNLQLNVFMPRGLPHRETLTEFSIGATIDPLR